MSGRLRKFFSLLLLAAFAGLLQSPLFTTSQQLQAGSGAVHADVIAALQKSSSVGVIISLRELEGVPEPATLAELKQNAAERQASVLADLAPADFTLGYQYSVIAALAGSLTASGVPVLDTHPDVLSVTLNREASLELSESVPLI